MVFSQDLKPEHWELNWKRWDQETNMDGLDKIVWASVMKIPGATESFLSFRCICQLSFFLTVEGIFKNSKQVSARSSCCERQRATVEFFFVPPNTRRHGRYGFHIMQTSCFLGTTCCYHTDDQKKEINKTPLEGREGGFGWERASYRPQLYGQSWHANDTTHRNHTSVAMESIPHHSLKLKEHSFDFLMYFIVRLVVILWGKIIIIPAEYRNALLYVIMQLKHLIFLALVYLREAPWTSICCDVLAASAAAQTRALKHLNCEERNCVHP